MKRQYFFNLFFVALVLVMYGCGESNLDEGISEGKDYLELGYSLKSSSESIIEVTEAFSYTCFHCYTFEPDVTPWIKKQATDVLLVKQHVNFTLDSISYQRGYYTMIKLGLLEKNHIRVFEELHRTDRPKLMSSAEQWADFLVNQGVDRQLIIDTYNSKYIDDVVKGVDDIAKREKITGTPQLIIDGKYVVINGVENSRKLEVAEFLINKIRNDRKKD
jgi:protein dithiol oxidoreductase (disulfide-forming)